LYCTFYQKKLLKMEKKNYRVCQIFLYFGAQKSFGRFWLNSSISADSQIAAGKRAGRERGWPLAVANRGLPLISVGAIQVQCRARIFQLFGAQKSAPPKVSQCPFSRRESQK
jgi:hypothetical protein